MRERSRHRQLTVSGGYSGGETPLPIPNREVKPASADGTRRATSRESRSPPVFLERVAARRPFRGWGSYGATTQGANVRTRLQEPRIRAGAGRPVAEPFERDGVPRRGAALVLEGEEPLRPVQHAASALERSVLRRPALTVHDLPRAGARVLELAREREPHVAVGRAQPPASVRPQTAGAVADVPAREPLRFPREWALRAGPAAHAGQRLPCPHTRARSAHRSNRRSDAVSALSSSSFFRPRGR